MATGSAARRLARVLIVEDQEGQRRTVADILEDNGFRTVACSSGAEALDWLAREDFAVAVIDQRLPDLTGTRLLDEMQKRSPGIRAIIHTAYGSFESAKEAVNVGAFAYVEKAGNPEDLVTHVRRAVQDLMNDALLGTAARLRTIVDNAPDFIVQTDERGVISYVNRPPEGRTFEDLVGGSIFDWISAWSHENVRAALARVFASGKVASYECGGDDSRGGESRLEGRVAPVVVGDRVISAIHILRELRASH